jgi:hypothetical protein
VKKLYVYSQIFDWYTKDFHRRDMKQFPAEAKPPAEAAVLAVLRLARKTSRRGDTFTTRALRVEA